MHVLGPTLHKNSVASPAILSFRPNSVENADYQGQTIQNQHPQE